MTDARVYAVAGAKGGVGKTTTSLNLGTAFAMRGATTVVVELDLAMANVVDFLDLPVDLDDAVTLHEVLSGEAEVSEAVYAAPSGIDVVPSGTDIGGFASADVGRLSSVLPTLRAEYDRIVFDTGAGLSEETVVPVGKADDAVVVSTPRVAAVRDAEKTARLAERLDTDIAGVVFTKSGTGRAPPPSRLAEFLDLELLGHVPEDTAVPESQDVGEPVVTNAPDSPAASAYGEIASQLDRRAVRGPAADSDRDRDGGFVTGTLDSSSETGTEPTSEPEDRTWVAGTVPGTPDVETDDGRSPATDTVAGPDLQFDAVPRYGAASRSRTATEPVADTEPTGGTDESRVAPTGTAADEPIDEAVPADGTAAETADVTEAGAATGTDDRPGEGDDDGDAGSADDASLLERAKSLFGRT